MKRAFTLTELLIVISVIVVLAGVAIPVIGIVRRQAKDVQCRNNLQQIFTGITGYRHSVGKIMSDFRARQSSQVMLEGDALAKLANGLLRQFFIQLRLAEQHHLH